MCHKSSCYKRARVAYYRPSTIRAPTFSETNVAAPWYLTCRNGRFYHSTRKFIAKHTAPKTTRTAPRIRNHPQISTRIRTFRRTPKRGSNTRQCEKVGTSHTYLGTDRILQARAGRRCQRRGGRPGADPIGSTWAHGVVGETRSDLEPSCEQAAACRRVIGQQQASERARGGRPFPPARSEARARTPPRNPNPCTRKKMQWQQYSIKTF